MARAQGQLPLDFTDSVSQRHRKALLRAQDQPQLFATAPIDVDVHLHSPREAIAELGGDPDRTRIWLERIVGPTQHVRGRKVTFPAVYLDRLLAVRPPAKATLDAACLAVARAAWAANLNLRPLVVRRDRQRLLASSVRWPTGLAVTDAPWPAIAVLNDLGIPFEIEPTAKALMTNKLVDSGSQIATAGLSGSSVVLHTRRPELLEDLKLPGLGYLGAPESGQYRMPLLLAECLLTQNGIELSPTVRKRIIEVSRRVRPMADIPGFPWNLYAFQARDAARAVRILETTGGVLLAGDMGSGKTTVALALAAQMNIWPLLVVAPLSAFSTWERQLGELGKSTYLATEAPKRSWAAIESRAYEVVVISYDRLPAFVELVEQYGFQGIVADELQRIRTPGSRRSRAIRALASATPYRIGLSGTPLTNKVDDLLPVGSFLVPGEWKPRATAKALADLYPGDAVEAVAEHLGTMMVRRRMSEVGAKLPKRRDHRVFVQLTPEQRRALADLEAEAEAAKEAGEFDEPGSKMHAFVRLQRMRQIIADPAGAGIGGPNPKVRAAIDLAEDFLAQGRKGVIFCADRNVFRELGEALDDAKIGWVGIWGATPINDRIRNEKRFHTDPDTKIVLCTIQAGSESWSASPTGTWLISCSYVYAPSTLSQMEARVYRMSSDPNGPDIEILYLHAQAPGGTLDDRFVEILEVKKQLFAQVVDRTTHDDTTQVHLSLGDLTYMLTGRRDEVQDTKDADNLAVIDREQARKAHARKTAHGHKKSVRIAADGFHDDGAIAATLEELLDAEDAVEATARVAGVVTSGAAPDDLFDEGDDGDIRD